MVIKRKVKQIFKMINTGLPSDSIMVGVSPAEKHQGCSLSAPEKLVIRWILSPVVQIPLPAVFRNYFDT